MGEGVAVRAHCDTGARWSASEARPTTLKGHAQDGTRSHTSLCPQQQHIIPRPRHAAATAPQHALPLPGAMSRDSLFKRVPLAPPACQDAACRSGNRPCHQHAAAAGSLRGHFPWATANAAQSGSLLSSGRASQGQSAGSVSASVSVRPAASQSGEGQHGGAGAAAQARPANLVDPTPSNILAVSLQNTVSQQHGSVGGDADTAAPGVPAAAPRCSHGSCGLSVHDALTAIAFACACPIPGCQYVYRLKNIKDLLTALERELAQHSPEELAKIPLQTFCERSGPIAVRIRYYLRLHISMCHAGACLLAHACFDAAMQLCVRGTHSLVRLRPHHACVAPCLLASVELMCLSCARTQLT